MMRRIRRVVGVVDARRVDANEPHSQIQEKACPGSRQSGTVEQVGGRASMSFPPAGAKQDRVPFPYCATRRAPGGPQAPGQDPSFLRDAAKVEDLTRRAERVTR